MPLGPSELLDGLAAAVPGPDLLAPGNAGVPFFDLLDIRGLVVFVGDFFCSSVASMVSGPQQVFDF